MDSVLSIIKSSTPDGLAPLSLVGSTVFIHLFGILTVTWAILNLFVLINKGKVQQDSVTDGSLMANIGAVL